MTIAVMLAISSILAFGALMRIRFRLKHQGEVGATMVFLVGLVFLGIPLGIIRSADLPAPLEQKFAGYVTLVVILAVYVGASMVLFVTKPRRPSRRMRPATT